ncbi:hypothetical protein [Pontibacter pamirensis]|uniref:hypothetical protein n=1 Tax=Pontibacter pamirensis TaxID=2562824 RepID=UPI00138A0CCC|nr:hypothetical protein [Pontibacter pamirensis]
MAWSTFFGVVMGAYAVYYVLNLLYDLFFSQKQKAATDSGVHYDMEELASDEEQPYDLSQGEAGDDDQYEGEQYEDEDEDQPYEQEELSRTAEPEPALRVEGQGIPLEEFLKDAKSYSSSIF